MLIVEMNLSKAERTSGVFCLFFFFERLGFTRCGKWVRLWTQELKFFSKVAHEGVGDEKEDKELPENISKT